MDNNQANPVTPPTVSDPFFTAPSPSHVTPVVTPVTPSEPVPTTPTAPTPEPFSAPSFPVTPQTPVVPETPPTSPMAFPPPPIETPAPVVTPPVTAPSFAPPPAPVAIPPVFNPPVNPTPATPPTPVTPLTPPVAAPAVPEAVSPQSNVLREGKGSGKYQIRVIPDKCIGAASCIAVAPKAFRLDDQQIAEVLNSVGEETDENLLLAAQSCPTLAIEVIDTETGEKVWPK